MISLVFLITSSVVTWCVKYLNSTIFVLGYNCAYTEIVHTQKQPLDHFWEYRSAIVLRQAALAREVDGQPIDPPNPRKETPLATVLGE